MHQLTSKTELWVISLVYMITSPFWFDFNTIWLFCVSACSSWLGKNPPKLWVISICLHGLLPLSDLIWRKLSLNTIWLFCVSACSSWLEKNWTMSYFPLFTWIISPFWFNLKNKRVWKKSIDVCTYYINYSISVILCNPWKGIKLVYLSI